MSCSVAKQTVCLITTFTMKRIILITIFFLFNTVLLLAQLTLEECYEKARKNYPLIKQYELIDKSKNYDISNIRKGYLPQFSLSAKASYQSDVTKIPIIIPNMNIEGISKDKYQAVLEMNQTIWDGGNIKAQKNSSKFASELEKQQTETELFVLRERINQLFFSILLINEQLKQTEILSNEFQNNFERIKALKDNGMASQADLDAIRVEQLKTAQQKTELEGTLKAFGGMISIFIGESVSESTIFIKPEIHLPETDLSNKRPELSLFEAQKNLFENNKKIVNTALMPRIGLFAQAGYGKPGLNMLKNEFSPFFIGGVRFNWNFGVFYTKENAIKKIDLDIDKTQIKKDVFLFNTDVKVSQQMNEIKKMKKILLSDDEIIELRRNIKKSAQIRVENGTLSVSDLVREINAEHLAIQEKFLHEIQLLMCIENLKNILNY